MLGRYIQIWTFADRLEIQSPGDLYGTVTEENLEVEHSTRNLMRLSAASIRRWNRSAPEHRQA